MLHASTAQTLVTTVEMDKTKTLDRQDWKTVIMLILPDMIMTVPGAHQEVTPINNGDVTTQPVPP